MLLTSAPGFEDFARTLLSTGNAEDVVLKSAGGGERTIRAIVRQKAREFPESQRGYAMKTMLNTLRVDPSDILDIQKDDSFEVRGVTYRIAENGNGIRPDGVAMVTIDLETTPR